jgi:hypothetical protein
LTAFSPSRVHCQPPIQPARRQPVQALQSGQAATDGAYLRTPPTFNFGIYSRALKLYQCPGMIAKGCSNAGSILDNFVLLHPDIELLDFRNPKIFQMCRRFFEG